MLPRVYFFGEPVAAFLTIIHIEQFKHGKSDERVQDSPQHQYQEHNQLLTGSRQIVLPETHCRHGHDHNFEAVHKTHRVVAFETDQVEAVGEEDNRKELNSENFHHAHFSHQGLDSEEEVLTGVEPVRSDQSVGTDITEHTGIYDVFEGDDNPEHYGQMEVVVDVLSPDCRMQHDQYEVKYVRELEFNFLCDALGQVELHFHL